MVAMAAKHNGSRHFKKYHFKHFLALDVNSP